MSIESPICDGGYSSVVKLLLHAGGTTLRLTQVSSSELFFSEPVVLSAGPAVVDISVDEIVNSYPIHILDHSAASTRIPISLSQKNTLAEEQVNL